MRPYSPGGMLNALAAALKGGNPPTLSIHRLRYGLPGYLILFATHTFEPQRQLQTRQPPSPLVFFHISTHFTATHGVPLSSSALKFPSFRCTSSVEPKAFTSDLKTACARFTPNKSGQRLPPTYYRGCWHVVSRGFLVKYRQYLNSYSQICSSLTTEFYEPKPFFTHAALLHQTFVHCGRFPTAASRRSLGRVSVPMWPITLSGRLRIIAMVSRYLTI